jgi:hypothetical protein
MQALPKMSAMKSYLLLIGLVSFPAIGWADLEIDPKNWKVTLPLPNGKGEALEVTNPDFERYLADPDAIPGKHARFFRREGGAMIFYCPAGGATTKNTDYPRSELREMEVDTGENEYEWTLMEGGALELRFKVGPFEEGAEKLMFAQIHGHEPERKVLLKCLWHKGHLRIKGKSGEKLKDYEVQRRYLPLNEGEWYTCRIEASKEAVSVAMDGVVIETFGREVLKYWPADNTYYFKAGNYLQERKEGRAATVSISHISVRH